MRATIRDWLSQRVEQLRNRSFLQASMAAAALVATADEDVRLSEQLALDELLGRVEKLRVFAVHDAVDLHRDFVERILANAAAGRAAALEAVSAFRGDEDQRLLVLYVGAVIAKADLELSETEERALNEICGALALPESALARVWNADAESAGPASS
ncbi:MAG: TerB family tellurite resistance protein [Myxococcota bacterium]|nr:TerB family tellurite resistance protein [Myxococcota bacterium]